MDVKELRIGNLITYAGRVGKVTQLDSEEGVYFDGLDSSHLNGLYEDGFEGIPLTEEWLLVFGFEHYRTKYYRLRYGSVDWGRYILYGIGNPHIEMCSREGWTTAQAVCENVHQLQNLYFALQGEELKRSKLTTNH